jgi:hypothetical protein
MKDPIKAYLDSVRTKNPSPETEKLMKELKQLAKDFEKYNSLK